MTVKTSWLGPCFNCERELPPSECGLRQYVHSRNLSIESCVGEEDGVRVLTTTRVANPMAKGMCTYEVIEIPEDKVLDLRAVSYRDNKHK